MDEASGSRSQSSAVESKPCSVDSSVNGTSTVTTSVSNSSSTHDRNQSNSKTSESTSSVKDAVARAKEKAAQIAAAHNSKSGSATKSTSATTVDQRTNAEKRRSNWSAEDLSSMDSSKGEKFLKLAGAGKKAKKIMSEKDGKSKGAGYYASQQKELESQFMAGLQYGRGSRGLGR